MGELDEGMRTHIAIYNPVHPWLEMSNEEMLRSAGFWRRDHLTNHEGYILAVVLLFGKEQTILLDEGLLSMTFPDRPNHQEQKYIITEKGKEICCQD